MQPLTIIAPAQFVTSEQWGRRAEPPAGSQMLDPGTRVKYLGHVVGGMVRVELPDGRVGVIHPHATRELRS